MKKSEFYYELPENNCSTSKSNRDKSRLVLNLIELLKIILYEIVDFLRPGDCLVINNTKVIPEGYLAGEKTLVLR